MRFLLISDTHGKLESINELAADAQADVVIHAGDFGFYDDGSYERLSDREFRLHVIHSDLAPLEKGEILNLPRKERIEAARTNCPLSEFPSYITGERRFNVPVHAVWGNHEDKHVVEMVVNGDIRIDNLHIIHHRRAYRVGTTLIYGLGGNFLAGAKLLQSSIAGGAGRIWSTLTQYSDLIETTAQEDQPGTRIFVSHVSPGKEPFVELVAARTRADFTVSGHMGAPACMVWNPFAVSSVEEATLRLQKGIEDVRKACLDAPRSEEPWVEQAFSKIGRFPEETTRTGRGREEPWWFRGMTHINLPDAQVGYAILDVEGTRTAIQSAVR